LPAGTVFFESVNLNSAGEPAVTLTVVAFVAAGWAEAGSAHRRAAAKTARPRTPNFLVRRGKLLSSH
jgi:hypothetical protein